ncbi:MAG: hypothetical protein HRU07_01245 [Nitrosopumilus sp.]|nr:hypothetical protein [Nitrosopumilus sp.]NRA04799.1 hypothetical protein [Nitrosopumilus sp.]
MATPNERTETDLILKDNEPLNIKKLGLDGAYRWLKLTVILSMTNLGVAPVFKEDDILNYITAVGIRRNGKFFKFNLPLRFAYKLQTSDVGTPAFYQAPITTINETYDAIAEYTIHFAEDILNENDISALLQTKNLTNLELVISTGDKEDIASVNAPTINSAKVEIEIRDFTGEGRKGGDINDSKSENMTDITEIVEEIDLQTGRTDYVKKAQEIDMVSGSSILVHAGLVLDNGVASNDRVTGFRTWNVPPRTSDFERNFKGLVRDTKTNYALENTINGFFKINWQEKLGRLGFVTGVKSKELIQLLTNGIVSKEDTILLYTKSV